MSLIYADVNKLSESLRIVVESDRSQEVVRLIKDYMKEPEDVGWDDIRPKTTLEIMKSLKPLIIGKP